MKAHRFSARDWPTLDEQRDLLEFSRADALIQVLRGHACYEGLPGAEPEPVCTQMRGLPRLYANNQVYRG